MKKNYVSILSLIMMTSAFSQNLLLNGHMEWGADKEWSDEVSGNAAAIFSSSTDAASGAVSKKIEVTTAGTQNHEVQTRQTVNIESGSIYRLTFSAKASANLDMVVSVQETGGSFSSLIFQTVNLTTAWQEYSYSNVSSLASTAQEIAAQFQVGTIQGSFWIDDVRVEEVGLVNGDFEAGLSSAWFTSAGGGGVTFELEQGGANITEATSAAKIISTATSANIYDAQLATNFGTQQITSGDQYRVSFSAKSGAMLSTETIQLALQNAANFGNAATGNDSYSAFSPTTDFATYSQFFTAAFTTGGSDNLQVAFQFGSTIGTIYLDDVKVKKATTWTGNSDSNWNNAANWSNGVPTSNLFTRIPSATNQPTASALTISASGLDIASGATLTLQNTIFTVNGETIHEGAIIMDSQSSLNLQEDLMGSGTIEYTRTYSYNDGRYSMVGSPVLGANTTSLGSFAYSYDESKDYSLNEGAARFIDVTSGETMSAGKGYFTAGSASTVFSGKPNHGDQVVNLSYTATGSAEGFNLLANPYPSVINAEYFLQANTGTTGSLYIWDDNGSNSQRGTNDDYFIVNKLGTVGSGNDSTSINSGNWDGNLRVGQGFFVQTQSASNTAIFSNGMKTANTNSNSGYFRKSSEQASEETIKIRLKSSKGLLKETLIGFVEGATRGFDQGWDAEKISTQPMQIFTLMEDKKLAIQSVGDKSKSINVGIVLPETGTYSLAFDHSMSDVLLYDRLEDKVVSGLSPYSFKGSKGEDADRFELFFEKEESLSFDLSRQWFLNDGKFYMKEVPAYQDVFIYDLSGKILKRETLLHANDGIDLTDFYDRPIIIKTNKMTLKIFMNN